MSGNRTGDEIALNKNSKYAVSISRSNGLISATVNAYDATYNGQGNIPNSKCNPQHCESEATLADESPTMSLESVATTLQRVQGVMNKINRQIGKTSKAVKRVQRRLNLQGQRVYKLQHSLMTVENNPKLCLLQQPLSCQKPVSGSRASNPCRSVLWSSSPTNGPSSLPSPVRCSKGVLSPTSFPTVPSSSRGRLHSSSRPLLHNPQPNRCVQRVAESFSCPRCCFSNDEEIPTPLNRDLLKAAHDGLVDDVWELLAAGADVNFCNSTKWTPLHRAAAQGHACVVELLLESCARVNARTSYGLTPLHMACAHDHSGRCVRALIEAGADVASRCRSGQAPLHFAARSSNVPAVQALLAAGAKKLVLDCQGKTPRDVARGSCRRLLRYVRQNSGTSVPAAGLPFPGPSTWATHCVRSPHPLYI